MKEGLELMKEITLNAILLQILRRKRLFALVILIPLVLGMVLGVQKSLSPVSSGEQQEEPLSFNYRKTQYDALESLYLSQQKSLKESILLNFDPSAVTTRRHAIFIDDSSRVEGGAQVQTANEIGYFYSFYKFTSQDYVQFKRILGNASLSDEQVDELVAQAYNDDLNLLTLAAVHEDPAVAEALGNYNYDRIMGIYEAQANKTYELKEIGATTQKKADETIMQRLTLRIEQLDDYKKQMDELRPALVLPTDPSAGVSAGSILRSVAKWGLLGLFGGLALAFVLAAVLAGRSMMIHDSADLEQLTGRPLLGFIPDGSQKLADRLIFGTVTQKDQTERLLSRLSLDLKDAQAHRLTLIQLGAASASKLQTTLSDQLKETEVELLERFDYDHLSEIGPDSQVVLVANPMISRSELKNVQELAQKAGARLFGTVIIAE